MKNELLWLLVSLPEQTGIEQKRAAWDGMSNQCRLVEEWVAAKVTHTAGPWIVVEDGSLSDGLWISPLDGSEPVICDLVGRVFDREAGCSQLTAEDQANARLIAAAPELLEACKGILAGFEVGIFCRSIDADSQPGWALKLIGPIRALAVAQQAIAKAEAK